MKTSIVLASLLLASWQAFALAPSGGEPNNTGCNGVGNSNSPCQPSNTNENTNGQSQAQGQGQAQGQIATGGNGTGVGIGIGKGGQGGSANASGGSATSGSSSGAISGSYSSLSDSGNSSSVAKGGSVGDTSSASGATSTASNGDQSFSGTQTVANTNGGNTTASVASADGSGNSSTNVDASSHHNSQALFLPTLPGPAPTFVPGSSATVVAGQCGPLMATESEEVNGTYLGLIRKHSIYLGRTDRIVPYEGGEYVSRSYPDGSTRLFGHRAVRTTAVLNVAGSRQVSLGGGETGGNWGQGGAGGGSSMQRLVVQIDLEPCEAFHSVPVPPVVAVQVTPTPAKPKRRVVRRPDEVCRPAPAIPATTCPVK